MKLRAFVWKELNLDTNGQLRIGNEALHVAKLTKPTNGWCLLLTRYDISMKSGPFQCPQLRKGWPLLKVLMTRHLPGTEELGKLFECSISFLAQRFFIQYGVAVEIQIIIKLRPNASDSVLSRYVLSILWHLLLPEILQYLKCTKNLVNNGIKYQSQLLQPTGLEALDAPCCKEARSRCCWSQRVCPYRSQPCAVGRTEKNNGEKLGMNGWEVLKGEGNLLETGNN